MPSRRLLVLSLLAALTVVCLLLAVAVSVWFLLPAPFLAAGAYAAWLRMTPSRFFDALDSDANGTGHAPPF